MPNVPKSKHRSVRFSDEDWADLEMATAAQGSDRGTVLKELAAWYLRRPGAKLPKRPLLDVLGPPPGASERIEAPATANPGRSTVD
jgi:hypothetical protein